MTFTCALGVVFATTAPAQAPASAGSARTGAEGANAALETALRVLGSARDAYRMTDALAAAQACRGLASTAGKPVLARLCNERALRAARVLGDAHSFIAATDWQHRYGDGRGLDPAFAKVDLATLAHSLAPLAVDGKGGNVRLDYVHPLGARIDARSRKVEATGRVSAMRPEVAVDINGKRANALVDTGAPVPVVLDETRARKLGAVSLVKGVRPPGTFNAPDPVAGSASYAVVDRFTIGTLSMRNVLAVVMRDGTVPKPGVVVGLPVLARYPQVTFTSSQLLLDTAAGRCDGKPVPMSVRFAAEGAFGMLFPVRAGNKDADATFDTGMGFPMVISPASRLASGLQPPLQKQPASPAFIIHPGSIAIEVGPIRVKPYYVYVSRLRFPADVAIGSPVLLGADMEMDFANLTLCVIPRGHGEAR